MLGVILILHHRRRSNSTMTGKRKRSRSHRHDDNSLNSKQLLSSKDLPVKYALLTLYYPQVLTLREYLLSQLPQSSKVRRRKILSIGRDHQQQNLGNDKDSEVALTLDQTLIGVFALNDKDNADVERQKLWSSFSQRRSQGDSRVGEKSVLGSFVSQSEVGQISCQLWRILFRLFSRCYYFSAVNSLPICLRLPRPRWRAACSFFTECFHSYENSIRFPNTG